MKYTGYTKAQLIDWCQCLENNCHVQEERVNNQYELLKKQQAEVDRLREALSFYAMQKTIIKSVYNGKPCRMIYCCADVAEQALNGESEINE